VKPTEKESACNEQKPDGQNGQIQTTPTAISELLILPTVPAKLECTAKGGKARVLTSKECLEQLEEKERQKQEQEQLEQKRKGKRRLRRKKRKIKTSEEASEVNSEGKTDTKLQETKRREKKYVTFESEEGIVSSELEKHSQKDPESEVQPPQQSIRRQMQVESESEGAREPSLTRKNNVSKFVMKMDRPYHRQTIQQMATY